MIYHVSKHLRSAFSEAKIHPEILRHEGISECLSISWISLAERCFVLQHDKSSACPIKKEREYPLLKFYEAKSTCCMVPTFPSSYKKIPVFLILPLGS